MSSMDIYVYFQQYNITLQRSKYADLYWQLVTNQDSVGYTERHHIVPRSLGGDDIKTNITIISARKHFLSHYLLCKMFSGTRWFYPLIQAFNMMKASSESHNRYFNSRLYAYARKHMSAAMSQSQSGTKNSQHGSKWITNHIVDTSIKVKFDNIVDYLEQGWILGRRSSKFIDTMSTVPKQPTLKQLVGKSYLIFHSMYCDIVQVRYHVLYEYIVSGWILLETKSRINWITKNNINLVVDPSHIHHFLNCGWKLGFHNPNHKGTSGKTYKWINGKKVFD